MIINREISESAQQAALGYPVISITVPCHSGKTTLCLSVFPTKAYVKLEDPEIHVFSSEDRRGFLQQ